MSKLKRAAVAAACTAGLVVGAVASASPAYAVGLASYDCGGFGNPVDVEFARDTADNLVVSAELPFEVPPPATIEVDGIMAILAGPSSVVTNNVALPPGPYSSITLVGLSPTLGSAPASIALTITPPGVTVTCTLISGAGWPGTGV